MAVYYVLGSILVAWGLGLAIFGLLRADFPPSGQAGRALILVTVLIVAGTLTALLATTSKEHPREEAAKAAAKAQAGNAGAAPAPGAPASTVNVSEKEFSIALAGGNQLKAGKYTFAVANTGKIQHDFAIKGDGINEVKTPLIDAGKTNSLAVELKPGKYTFYCTVPGHEQSGMKVDVTVAGAAPATTRAPAKTNAPAVAVPVAEKEFSIAFPGGARLNVGKYAFQVRNTGTIQHDLAIQGVGVNAKTPLIDSGKAAVLNVSLKSGTYKFYCTVPGHEQAGMKVEVTVK